MEGVVYIDNAASERVDPAPEAEPRVRGQHDALSMPLHHGLTLHARHDGDFKIETVEIQLEM